MSEQLADGMSQINGGSTPVSFHVKCLSAFRRSFLFCFIFLLCESSFRVIAVTKMADLLGGIDAELVRVFGVDQVMEIIRQKLEMQQEELEIKRMQAHSQIAGARFEQQTKLIEVVLRELPNHKDHVYRSWWSTETKTQTAESKKFLEQLREAMHGMNANQAIEGNTGRSIMY